MSIYRSVLTWVHNRMVPEKERYVPPIVYYNYTFNMVGVGKLVTVTEENRDDACRKAYSMLTERELDNLEWAELVHQEISFVGKENGIFFRAILTRRM